MLLTLLQSQGPAPPPVIIDDTHDGDYLGKRLRKEREEAEARRRRVLALYERLVEGKEETPEPVEALIEAAGIETRADIVEAPALDLGPMLAALERALDMQRAMALEADDEEVMLLL